LTLPPPLMPFHLPVPCRNLKLPSVSPGARVVSRMTKSPSGSINLLYVSALNWPAITLTELSQWVVMLSNTLFSRLLMMIPLKSTLLTVNSSVAKRVVCVEDPHCVQSKDCSACATGMNRSKPKRVATPFFHLLIGIMLSLLFPYREHL
jgi:hypothetical protein